MSQEKFKIESGTRLDTSSEKDNKMMPKMQSNPKGPVD